MSISGIPSSNQSDYTSQNIPNKPRPFAQEFTQLGQDLQSGNLSAAQQDFVTLQSHTPQSSTPSLFSQITQQFNQLGQDLQSGNLSAAQQDYLQLKPELSAAAHIRHHHRPAEGGGQGQIIQLFQQLGQALKAGNVSSAQQLYATLQQDLQNGQNGGPTASPQSSSPAATGVSVSA